MSGRTDPLLHVVHEPEILTAEQWEQENAPALLGYTEDEAASDLATVRQAQQHGAYEAIARIYVNQGWRYFGHQSWEEFCAAEGVSVLALPRAERRELVAEMTESGMSTRAIGAALGVSDGTVRNDQSTAQDYAVDEPRQVLGTDGKTRTYPRPTKTVTVVEEVTVDADTGEVIEPIESHPFIANDPGYQLSVLRHAIAKHMTRVAPLLGVTPSEIADALLGDADLIDMMRRTRAGINEWVDDIETELASRGRLHIIGGNK